MLKEKYKNFLEIALNRKLREYDNVEMSASLADEENKHHKIREKQALEKEIKNLEKEIENL